MFIPAIIVSKGSGGGGGGAGLSFVGASSAPTPGTGSGTRTLTADFPSGLESGDIALLNMTSLHGVGPSTLTLPAGWTLGLEATLAGAYWAGFIWKRLDGTETGNQSVDIAVGSGTSSVRLGAMSVWRGCVAAGTPFESLVNKEQNSANAIAADVTPTVGSQIVVNMIGVDNDVTATPPAGYTEAFDHNTISGYDTTVSQNYIAVEAAGAIGEQTTVLSASARNGVMSVALLAA